MSIYVNSNISGLLVQIAYRRDAAIKKAGMRATVGTIVNYARWVEFGMWNPDDPASSTRRNSRPAHMFRKGAEATKEYFAQEAAKVNIMDSQSMADCLNRVALRLQNHIYKFTPVITGNLKRSYTIRKAGL